ncbi:thioesterase family protein [Nocardioides rotundus]|uniref:thioesterase family protein n=1 Tax=Nocardioides rotundus TaxID=1774216 RepID=UPI001CBFE9AF|nr:thioesterase family protein [Nocardioides rotundus]UAL29005.1 thioesterase family protein [Nocardioides rotundus]
MSEALLWSEPVRPEWVDYNGHLSEAYYVLVFGHATDAVMDRIGLDAAHRAAHRSSLYTVEAHVRYLAEVPPETVLEVRSEVIGRTGRLLRLWHEMRVDGRLCATEEILAVHVVDGAAAPFPDAVAERTATLLCSPGPDAGRAIRIG